jgi:C-terminal processing protease CtpA/Prc
MQEELRAHMMAAYSENDKPEQAWGQINDMLKHLGDPYTRRIEPE